MSKCVIGKFHSPRLGFGALPIRVWYGHGPLTLREDTGTWDYQQTGYAILAMHN